jgi:hypothetical protein
MVFRAIMGEPELLPHLLVAEALPEKLKQKARKHT